MEGGFRRDGPPRGGPRRFGGGNGGGNRGGPRRFNNGPREMHKITCSECGKDSEVPFRPRPDTPVYCRECFQKRQGGGAGAPPRHERRQEQESSETQDDDQSQDSEEF